MLGFLMERAVHISDIKHSIIFIGLGILAILPLYVIPRLFGLLATWIYNRFRSSNLEKEVVRIHSVHVYPLVGKVLLLGVEWSSVDFMATAARVSIVWQWWKKYCTYGGTKEPERDISVESFLERLTMELGRGSSVQISFSNLRVLVLNNSATYRSLSRGLQEGSRDFQRPEVVEMGVIPAWADGSLLILKRCSVCILGQEAEKSLLLRWDKLHYRLVAGDPDIQNESIHGEADSPKHEGHGVKVWGFSAASVPGNVQTFLAATRAGKRWRTNSNEQTPLLSSTLVLLQHCSWRGGSDRNSMGESKTRNKFNLWILIDNIELRVTAEGLHTLNTLVDRFNPNTYKEWERGSTEDPDCFGVSIFFRPASGAHFLRVPYKTRVATWLPYPQPAAQHEDGFQMTFSSSNTVGQVHIIIPKNATASGIVGDTSISTTIPDCRIQFLGAFPFAHSRVFQLNLRQENPLQWSAPRTWTISISASSATLLFLRDHLRHLSDMVASFTQESVEVNSNLFQAIKTKVRVEIYDFRINLGLHVNNILEEIPESEHVNDEWHIAMTGNHLSLVQDFEDGLYFDKIESLTRWTLRFQGCAAVLHSPEEETLPSVSRELFHIDDYATIDVESSYSYMDDLPDALEIFKAKVELPSTSVSLHCRSIPYLARAYKNYFSDSQFSHVIRPGERVPSIPKLPISRNVECTVSINSQASIIIFNEGIDYQWPLNASPETNGDVTLEVGAANVNYFSKWPRSRMELEFGDKPVILSLGGVEHSLSLSAFKAVSESISDPYDACISTVGVELESIRGSCDGRLLSELNHMVNAFSSSFVDLEITSFPLSVHMLEIGSISLSLDIRRLRGQIELPCGLSFRQHNLFCESFAKEWELNFPEIHCTIPDKGGDSSSDNFILNCKDLLINQIQRPPFWNRSKAVTQREDIRKLEGYSATDFISLTDDEVKSHKWKSSWWFRSENNFRQGVAVESVDSGCCKYFIQVGSELNLRGSLKVFRKLFDVHRVFSCHTGEVFPVLKRSLAELWRFLRISDRAWVTKDQHAMRTDIVILMDTVALESPSGPGSKLLLSATSVRSHIVFGEDRIKLRARFPKLSLDLIKESDQRNFLICNGFQCLFSEESPEASATISVGSVFCPGYFEDFKNFEEGFGVVLATLRRLHNLAQNFSGKRSVVLNICAMQMIGYSLDQLFSVVTPEEARLHLLLAAESLKNSASNSLLRKTETVLGSLESRRGDFPEVQAKNLRLRVELEVNHVTWECGDSRIVWAPVSMTILLRDHSKSIVDIVIKRIRASITMKDLNEWMAKGFRDRESSKDRDDSTTDSGDEVSSCASLSMSKICLAMTSPFSMDMSGKPEEPSSSLQAQPRIQRIFSGRLSRKTIREGVNQFENKEAPTPPDWQSPLLFLRVHNGSLKVDECIRYRTRKFRLALFGLNRCVSSCSSIDLSFHGQTPVFGFRTVRPMVVFSPSGGENLRALVRVHRLLIYYNVGTLDTFAIQVKRYLDLFNQRAEGGRRSDYWYLDVLIDQVVSRCRGREYFKKADYLCSRFLVNIRSGESGSIYRLSQKLPRVVVDDISKLSWLPTLEVIAVDGEERNILLSIDPCKVPINFSVLTVFLERISLVKKLMIQSLASEKAFGAIGTSSRPPQLFFDLAPQEILVAFDTTSASAVLSLLPNSSSSASKTEKGNLNLNFERFSMNLSETGSDKVTSSFGGKGCNVRLIDTGERSLIHLHCDSFTSDISLKDFGQIQNFSQMKITTSDNLDAQLDSSYSILIAVLNISEISVKLLGEEGTGVLQFVSGACSIFFRMCGQRMSWFTKFQAPRLVELSSAEHCRSEVIEISGLWSEGLATVAVDIGTYFLEYRVISSFLSLFGSSEGGSDLRLDCRVNLSSGRVRALRLKPSFRVYPLEARVMFDKTTLVDLVVGRNESSMCFDLLKFLDGIRSPVNRVEAYGGRRGQAHRSLSPLTAVVVRVCPAVQLVSASAKFHSRLQIDLSSFLRAATCGLLTTVGEVHLLSVSCPNMKMESRISIQRSKSLTQDIRGLRALARVRGGLKAVSFFGHIEGMNQKLDLWSLYFLHCLLMRKNVNPGRGAKAVTPEESHFRSSVSLWIGGLPSTKRVPIRILCPLMEPEGQVGVSVCNVSCRFSIGRHMWAAICFDNFEAKLRWEHLLGSFSSKRGITTFAYHRDSSMEVYLWLRAITAALGRDRMKFLSLKSDTVLLEQIRLMDGPDSSKTKRRIGCGEVSCRCAVNTVSAFRRLVQLASRLLRDLVRDVSALKDDLGFGDESPDTVEQAWDTVPSVLVDGGKRSSLRELRLNATKLALTLHSLSLDDENSVEFVLRAPRMCLATSPLPTLRILDRFTMQFEEFAILSNGLQGSHQALLVRVPNPRVVMGVVRHNGDRPPICDFESDFNGPVEVSTFISQYNQLSDLIGSYYRVSRPRRPGDSTAVSGMAGTVLIFRTLRFEPRLSALGELTPNLETFLSWLGILSAEEIPRGLFELIIRPCSSI